METEKLEPKMEEPLHEKTKPIKKSDIERTFTARSILPFVEKEPVVWLEPATDIE